jgi:hypothetical protein
MSEILLLEILKCVNSHFHIFLGTLKISTNELIDKIRLHFTNAKLLVTIVLPITIMCKKLIKKWMLIIYMNINDITNNDINDPAPMMVVIYQ